MLEVWHSKTVKQFVKTTEKHWGDWNSLPKTRDGHMSHTRLWPWEQPFFLRRFTLSPHVPGDLPLYPPSLPILCVFPTLSLGPSGKKFNYQERLKPCSSSPLAL